MGKIRPQHTNTMSNLTCKQCGKESLGLGWPSNDLCRECFQLPTCKQCGKKEIPWAWPSDDLCGDCDRKEKKKNGTWIEFVPLEPKPKTKCWLVLNTQFRCSLGRISWHGPWRKYCFFPEAETVFEQTCLHEIAAFIDAETEAHKQLNKKKEK